MKTGTFLKTITFAAATLWSVATGSGVHAQTVDHSGGFGTHAEIIANGNTTFQDGRLRLTDVAGGGVSSAFTAHYVNVTRFQTSFNFQITSPGADGMAFVIQRVGAHALGVGGGGLGCYQIPNSVAVKFDFYPNDNDPWWSSTGVFVGGQAPFGGDAVEPSGINLRSGHLFRAEMAYGKQKLKLTITDTQTNARFTKEYSVNIPAAVGGDTAFVGFTASTGGFTATQEVLNWEFRSPSPVAPYYTLTNLGSLYNGSYAIPRAINNAGEVTGYFQNFPSPFTSFQDHPFLYSNGKLKNLIPNWATGVNAYGFALNNSGIIAGTDNFDTSSGSAFGYLFGDRAGMPIFGNDFSSAAYGINDNGEMAGVSTNVNGLDWFLWEISHGRGYATVWAGGTVFRLPSISNTEYSAAYDLNNRAGATGWFKRFGTTERHGIAWVSPGLTPQELPLSRPGEGWAINDYNEVAGITYEANGALRAFKLDENWQQRNLHSSNYFNSVAMGINNLGEIVGGWTSVYNPDHLFRGTTERAVYFTNNGGFDLNTRIPANSGVTLVEAAGINDKGQIAATGRFSNNVARPFLLNPVNPVAAISSLSPNSAVAGAGPVQMTITGSGFAPTAVVMWNGSPRETLFISETQLIVPISHTDVYNIGTAKVQIFTAAPGGGNSNEVNFPIVGRKIQGTMALEECVASAQPMKFWFQADTGETFQRTLTPDANGKFTFDVPASLYTVWVKGAKWLSKQVTIDTRSGNASVTVPLLAGDANDDNTIDVLDLDTLIAAFDSAAGDANWKEGADFNCDGSVDVFDLDLLIRNFDKSGE